jgi:hypothetical protein
MADASSRVTEVKQPVEKAVTVFTESNRFFFRLREECNLWAEKVPQRESRIF